jgi:DNA-binding FadR family transcriptional regulator
VSRTDGFRGGRAEAGVLPGSGSSPGTGRKAAAADALKAVRVPSVVDAVLQQLLGLIRAGVLKPGDQLPSETDLASRLRVGRSTIREVKQILGARGLLEFRGTHGCYIAAPEAGVFDPELLALLLTQDAAEHLHETREIVEVGAVRLAALRATDEDLSGLDLLLRELEEKKEYPRLFWPGTVEFHSRLIAATANPVIVRVHGVLAETTLAYQMPVYQTRADPLEVLAIHRRLLDAVRSRDPDRAAQEMVRHLDESHHRLSAPAAPATGVADAGVPAGEQPAEGASTHDGGVR